MMEEIWIAGAVRTPIGSLGGGLAGVAATKLGSIVIAESLHRAGVDASAVSEVIMGQVLTAGAGQAPARQAAIVAGLDASVGATTVNKVCGSGLKAVMLAVQAVRSGDATVVVAGGMESMSAAPHLLKGARAGYRLGHGQLLDSAVHDGLWDAYGDMHMGVCGDRCAEACDLSREQLDDFAVASYQRAIASADGRQSEIVAVDVPGRKGTVTFSDDEEPARFDEAKLRGLRPAFAGDGRTTAGNASSLNDGAAAVVVMSAATGKAMGVTPMARVVSYGSAARQPEWFTLAPIDAIAQTLERSGVKAGDVDLYEINEAFASVPLAAMQAHDLPHEKVNVRGGAVALGHPIGASGARVLVTLLHAMDERDAARGLASLCIGGGEAVAMLVERVQSSG